MTKKDKLKDLLKLPEVLEIIPVSRSTWLRGVASGKYPQPIRFIRLTFWDKKEISELHDNGT